MSVDINSFHRSIADVANSEGPEEEFTAEGSTVKRFLTLLILKLTMAEICLLVLTVKSCVT
jgi:hypothetical protein